MPPTPAAIRAALRARARADAAEREAQRLEAAAGIDRRALSIARATAGDDPAHQAILARMTVAMAAEICGTTPQVLAKAWAKGDQFRPARPEWRRALARYGVARDLWRGEA